MKARQLLPLFICNATPLTIGMGLFPLLPSYAAHFGATNTLVGLYLAIVSIASATSVSLTSWLGARFAPRKVFLVGSLLGPPSLWLLGQATTLWQVVLLTAMAWFSGGITLTLLSVYIGLAADKRSRGRTFSVMFLAYPVGAIVGGAIIGQVLAWSGYTMMFTILGLFWMVQPVLGWATLRQWPSARVVHVEPKTTVAPVGRTFAALLFSSLFALLAMNSGRLSTPLAMQNLAFAPSTIASTATVAGLFTIPVVLFLGTLSDRLGRARSLILTYVLAAFAIGTLLVATQLWHFWVAATLLFVAWCASRSIASALAADILQPQQLNRDLARLNTMDGVASIIGFAGTGFVLDTLGGTALYLLGLVLIGMAIFAQVQRQTHKTAPITSTFTSLSAVASGEPPIS
ncbi:MAG TPA: MFS transporter [Roseiflexaceae bacterium]|nr:MFS transporter [Roseiflexaceae bacterium]